MKRIYLLTTSILIASLVLAQTIGKDPKAKALLDEMSAKMKTFKTFKADFSFTIESKATGKTEVMKGNITVKGQKYILDTGDKNVYNDGKTVWTYYKKENEVNIYNYDPEEDNMSYTKIVDAYKTGYKYIKMNDEVIEGTSCAVLDLEPDLTPDQKKKNQVFKIRLHVDKKTKLVKRWKIFERNGNRYTTTVVKFTPNVPVTDNQFVFNKANHPGVVVEDMREEE